MTSDGGSDRWVVAMPVRCLSAGSMTFAGVRDSNLFSQPDQPSFEVSYEFSMSINPIFCALPADDLRARRDGELAALAKLARRSDWLPNGARLEFAAASETLAAITRIVDAERQCCRFLRFEIVVEPDGGAIALAVTGPDGTREFLDSLFPQ